MEYYVREIPGLQHPMEDSSYARIFRNSKDEELGLFMVADGLTQHGGTKASHNAIYTIANYLQENLHFSEQIDIERRIKEAIIKADENLKTFASTFTTLDLLLVTKDKAYTSHLGDGRIYVGNSGIPEQATTDEGSPNGGPDNYLGGESIRYPMPLAERIRFNTWNLKQDYFFLTTDGLITRSTPAEISRVLSRISKDFSNPNEILEELSYLIAFPKSKLLELTDEQIRVRIISPLSHFKPDLKLKHNELVELIMETYRLRDHPELNDRIDSLFKRDDTAMIFVDLKDRLSYSLNKGRIAEERTRELELTVSSQLKGIGELEQQVSSYNGEIERYKGEVERINQKLREVIDERDNLKRECQEEKEYVEAEMEKLDYSEPERSTPKHDASASNKKRKTVMEWLRGIVGEDSQ